MEPKVGAMMEMYREAETSVKLEGRMLKCFQGKVRVHPRLVLSPLLFAVVMQNARR